MSLALRYDTAKFREDLLDCRARMLFDLLLTGKPDSGGFFNTEQILTTVSRARRMVHRQAGHIRSQGTPSRSHHQLVFLIRIGCILADPRFGIKLNPDFVPKSQVRAIKAKAKAELEKP